jgi:predicted nucleotidyltransferase
MEARVERALERFATQAQAAFGQALASVVLFGSAAEDALRPSSDVNVMVVLRTFDEERAAALRDELALASAAVRLRAMFLLESELEDASEAFALKFGDMQRRHRVLVGRDPLAGLALPREARLRRLGQVLLNLVLRLRERVVARGDDAAALSALAAAVAGPLRAAAAELLELEGRPAPSPREALRLAASDPFDDLARAREGGQLELPEAQALVRRLLSVGESFRARMGSLA